MSKILMDCKNCIHQKVCKNKNNAKKNNAKNNKERLAASPYCDLGLDTTIMGHSLEEIELMISIFTQNGHSFPEIMDYAQEYANGVSHVEQIIAKQYEPFNEQIYKRR